MTVKRRIHTGASEKKAESIRVNAIVIAMKGKQKKAYAALQAFMVAVEAGRYGKGDDFDVNMWINEADELVYAAGTGHLIEEEISKTDAGKENSLEAWSDIILKKTVKVCMMVDWMAVPCEDAEYEDIEREMQLHTEIPANKFSFERRVHPHQLTNKRLDLYIIDFGGVMPGSEDTIVSHFRELVRQVEEKPNTLFIIWTRMTKGWYIEALQKENPELEAVNVIFRDEHAGWILAVNQWLTDAMKGG